MSPALRRAMRAANAIHVWIYRGSRGRLAGTTKGMPILLLTVRGRRTFRLRTAPVGFLNHDGAWIVAGSAGGMRDEPQWFRNLRKTDQAIAEIGNLKRDVAVTVTEGRQRDALWHLLLTAYPFFAGYQKKAAREIPVAILEVRE